MQSSPCRPLIRALLIDVSGTLHVGRCPTPGAVQALTRLRRAGIPFKLCSNTSKESTRSLIGRLKAQGFDIGDDEREVWTSIGAVKHTLHRLDCSRPFLLLSASAREEVVSDTVDDGSYDSVVVGLAPSELTFEKLDSAFRVLIGEEERSESRRVPLIATHKARYIQSDANDRLSLGPGPFVAALEFAAGVGAHVVGKPTASFFRTVIGDLEEINKGAIAVIGDDVENDLGEGALELGLWRVLVRTGKYRGDDEVRDGVVPPDEVYDSFACFVQSLLGNAE